MTRAHLLRAGLVLALVASAACSREGGGEQGADGASSGGGASSSAPGAAAGDSAKPEPRRANPDSVQAVIEQQRRAAGIRDEPTPAVAAKPAPSGYAGCMAQANAAGSADERAVLASTCKSYPDAPK